MRFTVGFASATSSRIACFCTLGNDDAASQVDPSKSRATSAATSHVAIGGITHGYPWLCDGKASDGLGVKVGGQCTLPNSAKASPAAYRRLSHYATVTPKQPDEGETRSTNLRVVDNTSRTKIVWPWSPSFLQSSNCLAAVPPPILETFGICCAVNLAKLPINSFLNKVGIRIGP